MTLPAPPNEPATMVVPSVPRSVSQVRRFAAASCTGCTDDVRDTVVLLVSEVATNALVHGSGEVEVRVLPGPGVLRVEVADEDPEPPTPRRAGADAEGGRGLALVAALASSWGTDRTSTGKVVWFEVRTS